jgi:deoxyribonuclease V
VRIKRIHDWNVTTSEARKLQERLVSSVVQRSLPRRISRIAATDVALEKNGTRAAAAVVVFSFPSLSELDLVIARGEVTFPYVPGLLTFREGPILIEALRKLSTRPDVVLFDGQGIAHFRGMGIASHVGLFLGIPTVGCAKSPLIRPAREPARERGSWSPIEREGLTVGASLRTRSNVRPVYVSPGHLADVRSSIRLVLGCCGKFRLPEPQRAAHMACRAAVRESFRQARKNIQ